MKLKRQPPTAQLRARAGTHRSSRRPASRRGERGRGRQARRPGPSLARRLVARLPSPARIIAVVAGAGVAAAMVALLNGPWLRVTDVAWAGERFSDTGELERILAAERGANALTVDTGALSRHVEELIAVADARVEVRLPGGLHALVTERRPALVWQTPRLQFVVATDGTLFAVLPDGERPADLATVPVVDDVRPAARRMRAGDVIPAGLIETARQLAAMDPAALGSSAGDFRLRLESEYGFVLVSAEPAWRIAFGYSGLDPGAEAGDIAGRLERQVTAVRTLFATQPEAGIGWVDARNPGKVYFRAKG